MSVIPLISYPIPMNLRPCLWFDAKDPAGNQTQPANNSSLASWVDKSGFGNTVAQGTGSKQPTFKTNQLNGLPGINFVKASIQEMTGGTATLPTGSSTRTVFLVAQIGTSQHQYFFGYGMNVSLQYCSLGTYTPAATLNTMLNWSAVFSTGGTTVTTGTGHHIAMNLSGTTAADSTIMLDGAAETLTTVGSGTISTTGNALVVGAYVAGALNLDGLIYEVLIYPYSLSSAQQAAVNAYLTAKWGV